MDNHQRSLFSQPETAVPSQKQQLTLTHSHHLDVFARREAVLTQDLKVEIDKIIGEQMQAHEQAVADWRQATVRGPPLDRALPSVLSQDEGNPSEGPKPTGWTPTQDDSTMDSTVPPSSMPTPKFKFNRECRDVFWLLIKNQNSWMGMMNEYK